MNQISSLFLKLPDITLEHKIEFLKIYEHFHDLDSPEAKVEFLKNNLKLLVFAAKEDNFEEPKKLYEETIRSLNIKDVEEEMKRIEYYTQGISSNKRVDVLKAINEDLKNTNSNTKSELDKLKVKYEDTLSELDKLKVKYEDTLSELDTINLKNKELMFEKSKLTSDYEALNNSKEVIQSELDSIKLKKEEVLKENSQLNSNYELLKNENSQLYSEIDDIKESKWIINTNLDSLKLQYEELKKENLIITSSLEDIQKDLDAEKLESKKYEVKYGVINSQLEVLNEKNKNEKTSIQSEFDLCKLEFEEHKLIPFHEYILLKDWMPAEFKKFKLELLYKATRDDFLAKTFHNKVNNIANTLTIVTIENGNRIGGFTPLKFKSSNSYKGDNSLKTFIFSLIKKVKFTLQEDQKQYAISDYGDDGPKFKFRRWRT